jgi:hypothetical protein
MMRCVVEHVKHNDRVDDVIDDDINDDVNECTDIIEWSHNADEV